MTPPVQSKDGVGRSPNARTKTSHRRTEVRSRVFRELVHIAAEQGATIDLGVSTADALQQCLDRAVALWRFAAHQVDGITLPHLDPDTDGSPGDWDPDDPSTWPTLSNLPAEDDPTFEVLTNPQGPDVIQDHRWYTREQEARKEIEKLAAMMTQLGIAERVVRVREAEAALLVAAVRDAAMSIGLGNDQIRALGAALRDRVADGLQTRQRPAHSSEGAVDTLKASATIEATIGDDSPA